MSLLDQLVKTKSKLKSTTTLVTRADGTQFVESGTSSTPTQLATKTHGFVIDTKSDNVPACIIEHLYLGSQDCAEPSVLFKYSIKHVLSLGVRIQPMITQQGDEITYKYVACLDLPETDLLSILQECLDFIDTARKNNANVLVHCNAGVSRSASVVIGYLITRCGMSYVQAYDHAKSLRSSIKPNDGFVKQLKQLVDYDNTISS